MHRIINPPELMEPRGYSHVVIAEGNRLVSIAGQTGHLTNGEIGAASLVGQFGIALENVVRALHVAAAAPEDLVSLQIFVTDVDDYRNHLAEIGSAYRKHLGKHYPAISLFEVSSLFDADAKVEIVGTAVVGDGSTTT